MRGGNFFEVDDLKAKRSPPSLSSQGHTPSGKEFHEVYFGTKRADAAADKSGIPGLLAGLKVASTSLIRTGEA